MNRMVDQQQRALNWAVRKGLCQAENVHTQLLKTTEELGELVGAVLKQDTAATAIEFGDVLFCLTIAADQLGLDFTGCLRRAVDKNEHRNGITVNGVFIRD